MEGLKVVCAWCGRILASGGPVVSHGICEGCRDRFVADLEAHAPRPQVPGAARLA
jgi:hypothetical protein